MKYTWAKEERAATVRVVGIILCDLAGGRERPKEALLGFEDAISGLEGDFWAAARIHDLSKWINICHPGIDEGQRRRLLSDGLRTARRLSVGRALQRLAIDCAGME